MVTKLNARPLFLTLFGILSFIATLGSAPMAAAQASQITNDLAVTISESRGTLAPGGRVTFTVSMTNHGPNKATCVDVAIKLPAQLKTLSITCDQGVTPDGTFCEYVSLPVGATVVSRLVATTKPGVRLQTRVLRISATADFENPGIIDPNLSNNTAAVRLRLVGRFRTP